MSNAKKRLIRNKDMIIVLIITFLLNTFCFKLTPHKIISFNELMNAMLSFSSIGTAFLLATLTFIPNFSEFSILIKKLNIDLKVVERLFLITLFYFFVSILSLLGLLFKMKYTLGLIFLSTWLSFTVVCLYVTLSIIFTVFSLIDDLMQKER